MTRSIGVMMGESGAHVGALYHDAVGGRERSAFAYTDAWLAAPDRFPIEPAVKLVLGPQFPAFSQQGSIFHGAIADTAPDGWARQIILRDHAKQRQAAARSGEPGPPPPSECDRFSAGGR